MNSNEMQAKLALLESQNDQLETELFNLNTLLVSCGFENGVESLKETVLEVLAEQEDPSAYNPNWN